MSDANRCIAGQTFKFSFLAEASGSAAPQLSPTLAAADFRISTNGGTLTALTNTPTNTPSGSAWVQVILSAAETTAAAAGGLIQFQAIDASGNEWKYWGCLIPVFAAEQASIGDQMNLANDAITAAKIAPDAITDAKVASDVTIASVTGSVGSVTSAVTVGTNNDKTGYGLSSTAIQSIWDALTSALTTSGSIGKRIVDNLDATISSRLATSGYTVPPTVTQVRTEMDSNSTKLANLDATVSSRSTLAATDVWNALLSGMSTAGSVGKRLSDNLDTTISSRLATSGYTAPPSAATIAFAVWNESTRTLTSFGTLIADIWSNVSRTLTSAGAGGGATAQEIWEYEERTLTSATEENAVGFANYRRCHK